MHISCWYERKFASEETLGCAFAQWHSCLTERTHLSTIQITHKRQILYVATNSGTQEHLNFLVRRKYQKELEGSRTSRTKCGKNIQPHSSTKCVSFVCFHQKNKKKKILVYLSSSLLDFLNFAAVYFPVFEKAVPVSYCVCLCLLYWMRRMLIKKNELHFISFWIKRTQIKTINIEYFPKQDKQSLASN